jgi:ribosomal-protein-alanine N-acetyltransferase
MSDTKNEILFETERFFLRPLTPADATDRYLSWLADQDARRFIQTANGMRSVDDLRSYIFSRLDKEDTLFLGIFERPNRQHIGNIKFEPIDIANSIAEMGILIGDAHWRGRGVAQEVIQASARWLKKNRKISTIELGVEVDNETAIKAYLRTGFTRGDVISDPRASSKIIRMTMAISA